MFKIALVGMTCVAMAWTASAEAETITVKWKKSGTLINQVQMGNPDGSSASPAVLIFGKAIGAPGPADIQIAYRRRSSLLVDVPRTIRRTSIQR